MFKTASNCSPFKHSTSENVTYLSSSQIG